jgi:hypothetical protein
MSERPPSVVNEEFVEILEATIWMEHEWVKGTSCIPFTHWSTSDVQFFDDITHPPTAAKVNLIVHKNKQASRQNFFLHPVTRVSNLSKRGISKSYLRPAAR